ncbi:hypothetical protein F2P79_022871 [Pimephales promelas]|nr:hypothetical protein F2P79_022871 [Pimephales promelas]
MSAWVSAQLPGPRSSRKQVSGQDRFPTRSSSETSSIEVRSTYCPRSNTRKTRIGQRADQNRLYLPSGISPDHLPVCLRYTLSQIRVCVCRSRTVLDSDNPLRSVQSCSGLSQERQRKQTRH